MIAVDTSVAVAAFGEWHQLNEPAREILDAGAVLPAHAMLETYSVLTGFPPPHRAAPELVDTWIEDRFAEVLSPPSSDQQRDLVRRLAAAGRTGGAIYDALVAVTVHLAGAELVTADLRATSTYEIIGIEARRLPGS